MSEKEIEAKPRRRRIYRKDFWTGRLIKGGVAVPDHNNVPRTLPDGTPLLNEEENQRRQSGTGSYAAHVAQADEGREEQKQQAGG